MIVCVCVCVLKNKAIINEGNLLNAAELTSQAAAGHYSLKCYYRKFVTICFWLVVATFM